MKIVISGNPEKRLKEALNKINTNIGKENSDIKTNLINNIEDAKEAVKSLLKDLEEWCKTKEEWLEAEVNWIQHIGNLSNRILTDIEVMETSAPNMDIDIIMQSLRWAKLRIMECRGRWIM